MTLSAGAEMWIPCEVAPGPFSDERAVLVRADGKEWSGFVNVKWLQEGVEKAPIKFLPKWWMWKGGSSTLVFRGTRCRAKCSRVM